MARRRADRVLVVVPAGLVLQWQDELHDKFGLEVALIENAAGLSREQSKLPAGVSPWDVLPHVLTSVDYLKKQDVQRRAFRRKWDLVIVDEAHALAESGTPQNPYRTRRTRLGEVLRESSRALLLLTATPHNGYSHTFRSLVELVEPSAATFWGEKARTRERVERAMVRRLKSQIRRKRDGHYERVFPKRNVEGIEVLAEAEEELFRKVSSYCSRTARSAAGSEQEDLVSFAMFIVKKRMLSSRIALEKTLDNRLRALKSEQERGEPPERNEIRDLRAGLPLTDAENERISQRVVKSAILPDEKKRKAEVRQLNEIRRLMKRLPGSDPKVERLVQELGRLQAEDPSEKVIVFTEYLDTLGAVQEALDSSHNFAGSYVILKGGLTARQRMKVQERFHQPGITAMLATDAASEGLNLQWMCRRIVHLELPWNPNRLEQRNGRVDRYGQTRKPEIRYLYYPNSPEDDVLHRLVGKIETMHEDRVSTPDILGVLSGCDDVVQGLVNLDPTGADVESRKQSLVRIFEDRTSDFVKNVKPLLMSGDDAQHEIEDIARLLERTAPLLPDDLALESLLGDVLGPQCFQATNEQGVYRVQVPRRFQGPGVQPLYKRATCRRSVATQTTASEVEFVSPLHPLVQAVAQEARAHLLQVYEEQPGVPPRRLAARRVPPGQPASILFTFLSAISGGHDLLEEQILPVRVSLDDTVLGNPEGNLTLLQEQDTAGEVSGETLDGLFREHFDQLYAVAKAEAQRLANVRARGLRRVRSEQAQVLRADLEAFKKDRLDEIAQEEARAGGRYDEDTKQLKLFAPEPVVTKQSFAAKRSAVDTSVKEREQEIAEFEQISEPEQPRPLGALFLVPEGVD